MYHWGERTNNTNSAPSIPNVEVAESDCENESDYGPKVIVALA